MNNYPKRSFLEKIYYFLHLKNYTKRQKKQFIFDDKYILSIGNLSAGGTGKTPVGIHIAKAAIDRGMKTGVVLRGYKGTMSKTGALVSDGRQVLCTAKEAGDEALLFSQISGLKVAVGKNRKEAIATHLPDCDFIIMDDFFQNPSVFTNHNLVLLDSTIPFSNLRMFPMGRFREPLEALKRANSVLFTRVDIADKKSINEWKLNIEGLNHKLEIFESAHKVTDITPPIPKKSKIGIVSGIGNPRAFYQSVEKSVGSISKQVIYADHYTPSLDEFRNVFLGNNLHWITTQKDLMRLEPLLANLMIERNRLHCLNIEIQILEKSKKFLNIMLGTSLLES